MQNLIKVGLKKLSQKSVASSNPEKWVFAPGLCHLENSALKRLKCYFNIESEFEHQISLKFA